MSAEGSVGYQLALVLGAVGVAFLLLAVVLAVVGLVMRDEKAMLPRYAGTALVTAVLGCLDLVASFCLMVVSGGQ